MKEREKWEENDLSLSQFSVTDSDYLRAHALNGSYPMYDTKMQRRGM